MTGRNAPLPSLNLTPPPHSAPGTRKAGKGKRSAFSLDNYLASTQPQASRPSRLATAVSLAPQDGYAYSEGVDRPALSPAEALLCNNDGVLAPLAASSAAPLSASASPPPPPSMFGYASGSWRSRLLHCETQLRELVAHGVHEPPSLDRMLQVIELFDHVSGEMEAQQGGAFLGTLLRLFRVEFCRAVFLDGDSPAEATNTAGGAAAPLSPSPGTQKGNGQVARARQAMDDGLPHTYFDEVASLQRTKAALTSSLANGASGEALLLLERQVDDKEEQLTWYRGELERVRTQYEQVADECVGLRRTLETQQRESAAQQRRLQQEIQTLHVENKDLQIQLFRLRKQISGGMAGLLKDSYQQLKLKKIGLTQRLFNEGDERIALLVFLSQVEGRLNEILDSYDNDFNLTPENSRPELQLKMAQTVTLLLEDMHYSEASYRRLVGAHSVRAADKSRSANASAASRSNGGGGGGNRSSGTASALQPIPVQLVHTGNTEEAPDESDGYVAILFDPKIYEQFQARHAVQGRLQQYKKEREEAAAAARSRPREDKDAPPFNGSDNSVMVTPLPTKTLTRQETLSNLLSGIFVGDAPTGVRARFGQGETQPESDTHGSANSVAGAAAHEERRKKWSLDSGAIAGGFSPASPSAGPSAPLTPQRVPHAPWQRFPAAGSTAGQSSSATHQPQQQEPQHSPQQSGDAVAASPAAATTATTVVAVGPQETLEDVVERQRAAWVAEILGPASSTAAFTVPGRHPERGDLVVVQERPAEVVPAELMMRRVLHHPMEDLCTERFLSTVEVFTGDNPAQQRLLCRVNHIDPAVPIRIPESTNFVKVKYALTENATLPAAVTTAAAAAAASAGATTTPAAGFVDEAAPPPAIFRGNPQLRLFKELGNKALVEGNLGLQYCAGAVNSTTASTVAYQRLHPMSPNRAPEWLLYQQLFGPYRSLAPRMMEVTTIDHVMACAAERYFTRMEYRYDECYLRAAGQCANFQLRRDMTERLFKDMHALSDFQEALVDELEARYGFPELVAKTLYEMLCYLNAVSEKDTVLSAYLDVIRGFAAPTEIHFMAYMLYHLSYCWPESNPSTAVPVADVRTVLEYLYRNASPIMPIRTEVILSDYDMATRSAPLNFVNFRQFIASTMAHQEESVLLHLHGLFHAYTQRAMVDEAGWDTYEAVIGKLWHQKDERRSLVRYLTSCLGVNRSSSPTLPQLTLLAASAWSSNLWE